MPEGDFVWYELMTTDVAAAAAFYGKVVGWDVRDSGMPGMTYLLAHMDDRQLAGLMPVPPDIGSPPPCWFGYVAVGDVDAVAETVKARGGAVHREPMDIPTVGRFAVVADPQGAPFMLFKGEGTPLDPPPPMSAGFAGWRELHTTDGAAAWDFYEDLFGFVKVDAMDMGPMGIYQIFRTPGAGEGMASGGMMTDPKAPRPYWLYYFAVPDIDAAAVRVTEAGGAILHGPAEVPGGAWIINATDPQGAMFALVGMRA